MHYLWPRKLTLLRAVFFALAGPVSRQLPEELAFNFRALKLFLFLEESRAISSAQWMEVAAAATQQRRTTDVGYEC